MHIYLLISENKSEAHVFSNLKIAKEKDSTMNNNTVYEWMELWCSPLDTDKDLFLHNDSEPWRFLKMAYEQKHWNTKAKYPEELIERIINKEY